MYVAKLFYLIIFSYKYYSYFFPRMSWSWSYGS